MLSDYALTHDRCAVCHWQKYRVGRALHIHHLQGGVARVHATFNVVLLCERCHTCVHDRLPGVPELSKGHILWAKRDADPEQYSTRDIARLTHRKRLPYRATRIPQFFLDERLRNRRGKNG